MNPEAIRQDLLRAPAILVGLLTNICPTQAKARSSPDAWSMLEVMCHLYDEEREDFRVRLDYILRRPDEPFPPIDPQRWVTERQYSLRDLETTLRNWEMERGASVDWLASLANVDWDVRRDMGEWSVSAGDMLCAWAAHDLLHIRQLVELRWGRLGEMAAPYHVGYAGGW